MILPLFPRADAGRSMPQQSTMPANGRQGGLIGSQKIRQAQLILDSLSLVCLLVLVAHFLNNARRAALLKVSLRPKRFNLLRSIHPAEQAGLILSCIMVLQHVIFLAVGSSAAPGLIKNDCSHSGQLVLPAILITPYAFAVFGCLVASRLMHKNQRPTHQWSVLVCLLIVIGLTFFTWIPTVAKRGSEACVRSLMSPTGRYASTALPLIIIILLVLIVAAGIISLRLLKSENLEQTQRIGANRMTYYLIFEIIIMFFVIPFYADQLRARRSKIDLNSARIATIMLSMSGIWFALLNLLDKMYSTGFNLAMNGPKEATQINRQRIRVVESKVPREHERDAETAAQDSLVTTDIQSDLFPMEKAHRRLRSDGGVSLILPMPEDEDISSRRSSMPLTVDSARSTTTPAQRSERLPVRPSGAATSYTVFPKHSKSSSMDSPHGQSIHRSSHLAPLYLSLDITLYPPGRDVPTHGPAPLRPKPHIQSASSGSAIEPDSSRSTAHRPTHKRSRSNIAEYRARTRPPSGEITVRKSQHLVLPDRPKPQNSRRSVSSHILPADLDSSSTIYSSSPPDENDDGIFTPLSSSPPKLPDPSRHSAITVSKFGIASAAASATTSPSPSRSPSPNSSDRTPSPNLVTTSAEPQNLVPPPPQDQLPPVPPIPPPAVISGMESVVRKKALPPIPLVRPRPSLRVGTAGHISAQQRQDVLLQQQQQQSHFLHQRTRSQREKRPKHPSQDPVQQQQQQQQQHDLPGRKFPPPPPSPQPNPSPPNRSVSPLSARRVGQGLRLNPVTPVRSRSPDPCN